MMTLASVTGHLFLNYGAPTTFTRAGLWSLVFRPDRTGPLTRAGPVFRPKPGPLTFSQLQLTKGGGGGVGVGEECCLLPSFLATFS